MNISDEAVEAAALKFVVYGGNGRRRLRSFESREDAEHTFGWGPFAWVKVGESCEPGAVGGVGGDNGFSVGTDIKRFQLLPKPADSRGFCLHLGVAKVVRIPLAPPVNKGM